MNGNLSCETCSMKDTCASAASLVNGSGAKPRSWFDLQAMVPCCPLELIAWASVSGSTTAFSRSSTFLQSTWIASPFSIGPTLPACVALGTDQLQNVADGQQWNFQHLTGKIDSTVAPCMTKVIFLRGGTEWKNQIGISLGGATYNDLQLTYRDNAGTRGDAQGTVPVIAFTGGNLTGNIVLEVVLKRFGHFKMGLKGKDGSNNHSIFEMEWVVV